MSYDYTAAPDATAVSDLLASVGLSSLASSLDEDLLEMYRLAAVKKIEKETGRQFVAGSAGEVRYYDGSGNGLLVIDEYIDITDIEFIIYPQAPVTSATNFVEVDTNGHPKTRLYIFQGASHLTRGYLPYFPEGRQNIKVTGQFGYGASIPADVFAAMVQESAATIVDEYVVTSGGGMPLKSWVNADRQETFDTQMIGSKAAGWRKNVGEVIARYRRTLRENRERTRPPLY